MGAVRKLILRRRGLIDKKPVVVFMIKFEKRCEQLSRESPESAAIRPAACVNSNSHAAYSTRSTCRVESALRSMRLTIGRRLNLLWCFRGRVAGGRRRLL